MCIFNVISGLIVCLGPYRMELVNKLKRKNLSNSHRYMFSAVEYLFLTIIFFAFVLPCQLLMLVVIFLSFYRIPRLCKNLFCDPGTTLYQKWIIRFGVIGSEFASIMKDIYNVMIKYKAAVAKEGPKGLKNAGACFKLYVFDTIVAMVISLIGILCFILALTCVVVSFVIEIAMAIVIACTVFNVMEFIDDVEDHFFENNNKPSLLFVTSTTIRRTVFGPKDSDHETIDIEDGTETDEEKKIEENDNEGKGDNAKSSENELAAQTNILRKLTKDGAAMERLLAMEILPRERVPPKRHARRADAVLSPPEQAPHAAQLRRAARGLPHAPRVVPLLDRQSRRGPAQVRVHDGPARARHRQHRPIRIYGAGRLPHLPQRPAGVDRRVRVERQHHR